MSLSVCGSVGLSPFCLSPGDKQIVCPPGDKHFSHTEGRGGQTFFVGGGGGFRDVDEEIDVSEANFPVSEANILVSEASKLSAGARILGARRALKF